MLSMSPLSLHLPPLREKSPSALQRLAAPFLQLPEKMGSLRNRLYNGSTTFWLFLFQTLSADKSCAEAVRAHLASLALQAKAMPSPDTGAYCKARLRLDQCDLDQIAADQLAMMKPDSRDLWCGRRVQLIDGTGLSMPDTPQNQKEWPQPKTQKKGCGFPILHMVVLFSLASGAVLGWAHDTLHVGERLLARQLWKLLQRGDVLLGDRGFCSFAEMWGLLERGVDSVMRLNQRRQAGLRILKRLGKNDFLVEWMKSGACPKGLSAEEWQAMPCTITLRQVTFTVEIKGWRSRQITVATTLLDPHAFSAKALAALYLRRWQVELFLRDIKITMGMDVLRCKTPAMIKKELTMFLIGYNLLRALMNQAIGMRGQKMEQISFKGALGTLRQWASRLHDAMMLSEEHWDIAIWRLLQCMSAGILPHRPGRCEPRAKKRRPKNYPLLTKPRRQYVEIPHRNHYKLA
jgi:hypothetical protein